MDKIMFLKSDIKKSIILSLGFLIIFAILYLLDNKFNFLSQIF